MEETLTEIMIEEEEHASKNEIQKMNMVCFWLIEQCNKTEAETMTVKQENVTKLGENLGDWEIVVKKVSPTTN